MDLSVTQIAAICYELNRVYCGILGDHSFPTWDFADNWQQQTNIDGVKKVLECRISSQLHRPEDSHESWMVEKLKAGWKYGEVKDPEKKEHPCLLPYSFLPEEQKLKDHLFTSTVNILLNLNPEFRKSSEVCHLPFMNYVGGQKDLGAQMGQTAGQ